MDVQYTRSALLGIVSLAPTAAFIGCVVIASVSNISSEIRSLGETYKNSCERDPLKVPAVAPIDYGEDVQAENRSAVRRVYDKIRSLRPAISDSVMYRVSSAVIETSNVTGLDEDLLIAIIRVESHFEPSAVSPAGARGLMQVMPFWSKVLPECVNLNDIRGNVRCGAQVYLMYYEQFGDPGIALAAYNRGPRWVSNDLKKGKNPVQAYSDDVIAYLQRIKYASGEQELATRF